eukprot:gnl/MRDRNA2_/MRDRNA2_81552_c0_seq1.p1 gnl/MRDRNA2_/MRDRNA2_81552_c0~~gnl/MRDRNA2_/MRDRNA2_81552_c0_seq1.p1  ORF type:complete len:488 (-),score=92.16 gnl/MRDRNA2_/MRDRNA2_81552_c0_seq1:205-1668(-)
MICVLFLLTLSSLAHAQEEGESVRVPRHKGRSHKLTQARSSWKQHQALVATKEHKSAATPSFQNLDSLPEQEVTKGTSKMSRNEIEKAMTEAEEHQLQAVAQGAGMDSLGAQSFSQDSLKAAATTSAAQQNFTNNPSTYATNAKAGDAAHQSEQSIRKQKDGHKQGQVSTDSSTLGATKFIDMLEDVNTVSAHQAFHAEERIHQEQPVADGRYEGVGNMADSSMLEEAEVDIKNSSALIAEESRRHPEPWTGHGGPVCCCFVGSCTQSIKAKIMGNDELIEMAQFTQRSARRSEGQQHCCVSLWRWERHCQWSFHRGYMGRWWWESSEKVELPRATLVDHGEATYNYGDKIKRGKYQEIGSLPDEKSAHYKWRKIEDPSGTFMKQTFYFNTDTKTSQWEHPSASKEVASFVKSKFKYNALFSPIGNSYPDTLWVDDYCRLSPYMPSAASQLPVYKDSCKGQGKTATIITDPNHWGGSVIAEKHLQCM